MQVININRKHPFRLTLRSEFSSCLLWVRNQPNLTMAPPRFGVNGSTGGSYHCRLELGPLGMMRMWLLFFSLMNITHYTAIEHENLAKLANI